jgi:hypothetical protein
MEGHLTLMGISIPSSGLHGTREQLYAGIKATFCHISWSIQDTDPSLVPMFHDLQDASPLCMGTRYTVDMWQIARQAAAYDARNYTFAATKPLVGQAAVPPTAVIFHQSRCGSTLMANILASYMPQHSRVYSEAPAPLTALLACSSSSSNDNNRTSSCDSTAQDALVQDVFYLMGRTPGALAPQYVFYKIQSLGTTAMHVFQRSMPHIPTVFAYRDPIEILMSHFKNFQTGNPLGADYMPNCLRNFGKQRQESSLVQLVTTTGRSVASLSKEEYCAAHLASLGQAAVMFHNTVAKENNSNNEATAKQQQQQQLLINYNELPYAVWERALPKLVPYVSQEQQERMQRMGRVYSKGRGDKGGAHWREDSTLKQGRAPESVRAAAALFMNPVYDELEQFRREQL